MTYVLIWFIWSNNGVTTHKEEFQTEQYCLEAKKQLDALAQSYLTIKSICVRK